MENQRIEKMKAQYIRWLLWMFSVLLLWSCKEPVTSLDQVITNSTSVRISVLSYKETITYKDTTLAVLNPGDSFTISLSRRGTVHSFPKSLFIGLANFDSIQVRFADTLNVVHYITNTNQTDSVNVPDEAIAYDEERNLYNHNNYSKEKIEEDHYKAEYNFRQSDLEYAQSIHE